jgi:hypothetical protein
VLRGARPGGFPNEFPERTLWLAVNLKTATALGVTVLAGLLYYLLRCMSPQVALFGPDRPGWRRLFLRVKRITNARAQSEN